MTYRALFKFNKLSDNAKTEYEKNVETFLKYVNAIGWEYTVEDMGMERVMKRFRLKVKKFIEEEAADEYNGDTVGMYIGGTIGTLMMVAMILWGGM